MGQGVTSIVVGPLSALKVRVHGEQGVGERERAIGQFVLC